jgi:NurA-like 5'-3' nuclease
MTDRELMQQWMRPGAIVPVDMNTVRILLDALRKRLADNTIHSCSYYCERPECVKEQRDELRELLAGGKK